MDGRRPAKIGTRRSIRATRSGQTHALAIARARVDERRKIAQDLHDELAQLLTAMRLDLGWLGRRVSPELTERVEALTRLVDGVHGQVRALATELRTPLSRALRERIRALEGRSGLRIELRIDGDPDGIAPAAATTIDRALQEALTNVVRHADASRVIASLRADEDEIVLEVTDDGRGIGPGRAKGLGLRGMRERATRLGGRLSVRRGPIGTVVTLTLPRRTR